MVQNMEIEHFTKAYLVAPTNFIKIPLEKIGLIKGLDPMKKSKVALFKHDFSSFEVVNES